MIQHVVVWKLVPMSDEDRAGTIDTIVQRLSALKNVIPGVESIRVTADLREIDSNADVCLISVHDSRAALEEYRGHPEHKAFAEWLSSRVNDRIAIDSEI